MVHGIICAVNMLISYNKIGHTSVWLSGKRESKYIFVVRIKPCYSVSIGNRRFWNRFKARETYKLKCIFYKPVPLMYVDRRKPNIWELSLFGDHTENHIPEMSSKIALRNSSREVRNDPGYIGVFFLGKKCNWTSKD